MIKHHCFKKDWINSFKAIEKYKKINPSILEKMIQALSLLQYLQTYNLEFTFKGGTSLILLLNDSNRFSVDIDILTEASRAKIESVLDQTITDSHFTSWSLDSKRSFMPGIPKAHYKLEYFSDLNSRPNYILLDILFENCHYPKILHCPIQCPWIENTTIINTQIPTVEGITGDKLTAFAPNTTGILYGKNKELEIIKQLFDLGNLFDAVKNLEELLESFTIFAQQEIEYRKLAIQPKTILMDTIETCRVITFREKNRIAKDKARFKELQTGIKSFTSHLIYGKFNIDEAIISASKVAFLCSKLLINDLTLIKPYNNQDVSNIQINLPGWNVLNRLKKWKNKSAFYYWFCCFENLYKSNNLQEIKD